MSGGARSRFVRGAVTVLAYLGALAVTVPVVFFVVLVLAGPHAGLLPNVLESVVLVVGWAAVLVLPSLAARRVWRRSAGGR